MSFWLWVLCEIAIIACDLAELLGSAIALQLLFNIPQARGVCIMSLDVVALLLLQKKGFRYIIDLTTRFSDNMNIINRGFRCLKNWFNFRKD